MDNLYRENILEHYRNPRNFGKLKNPDFSYEKENTLCGDRFAIMVKLSKRRKFQERKIKKIKFYGEGCAISTASASLLTEAVKGKTVSQAKKIGKKELLQLLGIEITLGRLKCALFPLEVLQKLLALASGE